METIITTSVIPHFDVFFIGKKHLCNFFIIQGHRQNQGQGQIVNFKVKSAKNMIFHKYNYRYKCYTSFRCVLTGKNIHIIVWIIQGHCQGQKVNFKVEGENKIFFPKKYNQIYLKKNRSKMQKYLHLTLKNSNGFASRILPQNTIT